MGGKKMQPIAGKARTYEVVTIAGVFTLDEKNNIVNYEKFPKDPEQIAENMKKAGSRRTDEAKEQFVRQNLRELAVKYGFVKDQLEFNKLMTKVNIALAKTEIKKAIGKDSLVVQLNGSLEELDKSINILIERLREFYSLHFPEMDRAIDDHEMYAKLVAQFGSRENMESPDLRKLAERSMGANLEKEDIAVVQEFAAKILGLHELRKDLEKYLDRLLSEVAPNLKAVAGPQIAGKLIARAGGLDKLARMPSSTIQLLGAEKALFRHLHGHGKSPKHGIISTHPLVQNAPKELKGKVARLLASKLSIAAKLDNYSKKNQSERLKRELQEKIKELAKK